MRYLRTEDSGPLFESMKAKLAGIASHTGMAGVFKLRGSDVYEVTSIERQPGTELPAPPRRCNPLAALRGVTQIMAGQTELASLLDATLAALERNFGIDHAMVLLLDARRDRLFTVASRGYPDSGIGSEIAIGRGVIGVATQHNVPIRIMHMTSDIAYSRAMRSSALSGGLAEQIETEIPLPGLAESRSQLAVPIVLNAAVAGILYVESLEDARFGYDDEDALVAIATQLGASIALLQQAHASAEPADEATSEGDAACCPEPSGEPALLRRYRVNDSVFIDDDYLIKGVAGSIFWKLVRDFTGSGRTDFSNRELRVDPSIRLPDIADNLEARLILLQRRLAERCEFLRIEKTGRGRFRLQVTRPLKLIEVA
jgi:adenylate cyclase